MLVIATSWSVGQFEQFGHFDQLRRELVAHALYLPPSNVDVSSHACMWASVNFV